MTPDSLRGRRVALGTLHGKERAIAPPLHRRLGLQVGVVAIDTDALGTFTGEVERPGSPREVVLRKARLAAAAAGLPLGLASEGSFGPHPALPWIPAGEEWLALVDLDSGREMAVRCLTLRTTHGQAVGRSMGEIADFLARARFPTHGVIVRPHSAAGPVVKGITDAEILARAMAAAVASSPDGLAMVESDLRAHMNPTRMGEIRRLAAILAKRLATPCPACGAAGFGPDKPVTGLPCGWCGTPTEIALGDGWACGACGHVEIRPRPHQPETADPGHCPVCNP
ncbi:MAG: hypothetical protein RLY86_3167 [Pseudomonadota bacterium]|jgi:hypothetical protein